MVYVYQSPFPGYRSALVLFYAMLWVYPLFGHAWTRKWGYLGPGASFGKVYWEIGLLDYTVHSDCGMFEYTRDWDPKASTKGALRVKSQELMKQYCKSLSNFDGTHDISIMVDLLALWDEGTRAWPGFSFVRQMAHISRTLRWISMLVFFLVMCSIQLLLFCAISLMNFEFIEGTKALRKMANGFFWSAIAIQAAVVLGYMLAITLSFMDVDFIRLNLTTLVINSPNADLCPCGNTTFIALALVFLGILLSSYTVCDLFTDKEMQKYAVEHGLTATERKALFGNFFEV